MTPSSHEALPTRKPIPSPRAMIKWLVLGVVLVTVTVLIVGWSLPREWSVEESVEIHGEIAQIHELVIDAERWKRWMFDPTLEDPGLTVEAVGVGVGATVRWSGERSNGGLLIVDVDPSHGIGWEGSFESDEVNSHGKIRYKPLAGGIVRVTLSTGGTVSLPLIGGYVVPFMEYELEEHVASALKRLKAAVEAE